MADNTGACEHMETVPGWWAVLVSWPDGSGEQTLCVPANNENDAARFARGVVQAVSQNHTREPIVRVQQVYQLRFPY